MIAVAPKSRTVEYRPKGGALALFRCRDDEALLDGPANTGKSRGILEYVLWFATAFPGCRIAFVRKTKVSLTTSALVTWETKVLRYIDEDGVERHLDPTYLKESLDDGPTRDHRKHYYFKNGSVIDLHGLDNPGRLFSTEYDLIYVQEAFELTEDEWEKLNRALRNKVAPYNQLVADTNPAEELHWLNQRCINGQTTRILSRHKDNPSCTEADLRKLRNMTGVRRKRLYEGLWVSAEGQIWDNFDRAVHVVNPDQQPTHRMPDGAREPWYPGGHIAGVDWGFRNPFCVIVAGADHDGRLWCRREVYRCGPTIAAEIDKSDSEEEAQAGVFAWQLRTMLALQKQYDIQRFLADPSEPEYIDQCRRAGLHMFPANNEWRPGVDLVRDRLAIAPDGKPRLYFVSDMRGKPDPDMLEQKRPTSVLEEIPSFIYEATKDGRQPNEKHDPGCDNHGCDALRYLVMHADRYDLRGQEEKPKYHPQSMYYVGGHDKEEERQQLREWGLEV